MSAPQTADQWKLGGDCSQCRRRSYCNKSCSAHRSRMDARIRMAMAGMMAKALSRPVRKSPAPPFPEPGLDDARAEAIRTLKAVEQKRAGEETQKEDGR